MRAFSFFFFSRRSRLDESLPSRSARFARPASTRCCLSVRFRASRSAARTTPSAPASEPAVAAAPEDAEAPSIAATLSSTMPSGFVS